MVPACGRTFRQPRETRTSVLFRRANEVAETPADTSVYRSSPLESAWPKTSLNAEKTQAWKFDEDLALNVGLLFRVLTPMRNLERICMVADGVAEMSREEIGYWLGMAMHRKHPRRALAALRLLMTSI